jgi:lysophospholipase L1-like esterase
MATMVLERKSRRQGVYAEVLEEILRADGIDAEVRNGATEFEMIDRGEKNFQEFERKFSPDVVVIQYGMAEAQPPFLPQPIYDHYMRWDTGFSRPALFYRSKIAARMWPWMRKYQRAAARLTETRFWRMNPRKFEGHLRRLIYLARYDYRLILVIDLNPPGGRIIYNLPGMPARRDRYQKIVLDAVADQNDPDIRMIMGSDLAEEFGIDTVMPDGYHWTPSAHRRIAEMLMAEIVPWAKTNLWETDAD